MSFLFLLIHCMYELLGREANPTCKLLATNHELPPPSCGDLRLAKFLDCHMMFSVLLVSFLFTHLFSSIFCYHHYLGIHEILLYLF
ncbi:hypothetical protein SLEP1_g12356 [Rubroshorea leprosula]|uniref:Uncharacterized protein n=1 Tax=Rubroshorea leprosula TaxID=152421 RepID=A0AAV5ILG1_9ROSI|nr:hypothetical protein SLEP1_g12356 [Rubroshorea leprosula]